MPIPRGFTERKLSPVRCDKRSFRTKKISKGRRLIICCPAGHWKPKSQRCSVGTKGKALLTPKKKR